MRKFALALLLLLATAVSAQAQQAVHQSGYVTPQHAACWTTNGVAQDCGTAAIPYLSSIGTVGQGPTICASSAAVSTGGYNQLCLAANQTSNAIISLQNYGSASAQNLCFNINGQQACIPSNLGNGFVTYIGTITPPDFACWSATGVIADCGALTLNAAGPTSATQIKNGTASGILWDSRSGGIDYLAAEQFVTVTQGGLGSSFASANGVLQWSSGTPSASSTLANGTSATTQTQGDISTLLATDAFVNTAVQGASAGLIVHTPVVAATTADLGSVTYNNGSSGIGATLTNAGTQAAFSVDGVNPTSTQRILVKNETTQTYNGIYTLTTVGSGSSNWVLTRATDANQPGTGNPNLIGSGTYVLVTGGNTQTNSSWIVNSTVTTIGTSVINWVLFISAFSGVTSLGGQSGVLGLQSTLSFSGSNLGVAAISVAGPTSGTQLLNGNANGVIIDNKSGGTDYATVSGAPWAGIAAALGAL